MNFERSKLVVFVLIVAAIIGFSVVVKMNSRRDSSTKLAYPHGKNSENSMDRVPSAVSDSAGGSSATETKGPNTQCEDVNKMNKYGKTPLMYACIKGSVSEVKRLIALGANVNAVNKHGRTPLRFAETHEPSHEIIALLLDAGADPSKLDDEGLNALCLEVGEDNGDMKSIEMLLSHEKDQPKAATHALYCLQGFHSYLRSASKAEFLLSRGADANHRGPDNTPFIVYFAGLGDPNALRVFVQNGHADVNATSSTGETALMSAAREKNAGNIEVLLKLGADCNRKNNDGLRALDLAKIREPNREWNEEHRIESISLLSRCTSALKQETGSSQK